MFKQDDGCRRTLRGQICCFTEQSKLWVGPKLGSWPVLLVLGLMPSSSWEAKGSRHRKESTEVELPCCVNSTVGPAEKLLPLYLPVQGQKQPTCCTRKATDSPREGPSKEITLERCLFLSSCLLTAQTRVPHFAVSPILIA